MVVVVVVVVVGGGGGSVGEVEYNTTKIYMNFVSLGLSKCLAF